MQALMLIMECLTREVGILVIKRRRSQGCCELKVQILASIVRCK